MKREELEKLGLEKDVIDQIMALHGKDVEKAKADLVTAQTETAALKTQLGEANAAIEGFKKLDVDGIKKAADEYKTKAEQAEAEAKRQVEGLKFDHALEGALVGAKAKNATAVRALLKVADLKLGEDGKIIGLDDQLKTIREANAFLFDAEDADPPPPQIVAGTNAPPATDPLWASMLKGAGLSEPKS